MTGTKYIGMDVHKESISMAVRNDAGKLVMECVIETKANVILDSIHGLRGELHVTFEEGTWATWLYDLLKPHVTKLVVCDPRKNSRQGNKNDRIDARELSDRLYMNKLSSVYHGGAGVRTLKELARSYLTISKDLGRHLTAFCFAGFGTDRLRCEEAMRTAYRENPNRWDNGSSNRAVGADGQNSSCSIKWAAKQETFPPMQECFFLTSPFIELTRS